MDDNNNLDDDKNINNEIINLDVNKIELNIIKTNTNIDSSILINDNNITKNKNKKKKKKKINQSRNPLQIIKTNSTQTYHLPELDDSCFDMPYEMKKSYSQNGMNQFKYTMNCYSDNFDFQSIAYSDSIQMAKLKCNAIFYATLFHKYYTHKGILGQIENHLPSVEGIIKSAQQTLEKIQSWKKTQLKRGKMEEYDIASYRFTFIYDYHILIQKTYIPP